MLSPFNVIGSRTIIAMKVLNETRTYVNHSFLISCGWFNILCVCVSIYSWKGFKSCKLFSVYFNRRNVNYVVLSCNKNGTTAPQEVKSYKWATILYYLYYRVSWKFIKSYSSVAFLICNSRKFFIVILSSSYVPRFRMLSRMHCLSSAWIIHRTTRCTSRCAYTRCSALLTLQ